MENQKKRTEDFPDPKSLPILDAKLPRPVMQVLETLQENGFQAYIVGGALRDLLMNKTPHDYDIATDAFPKTVMKLFRHTIPTGIKHGTVLVIEEGMPIEVTTFRKEGAYKDHRHPDQVEFVKDILEDLKRRDFTINAMAWNPKEGLIDPFGGYADILNKKIRAVGNPDLRFEEDALRMIRAWRFAAKLGFEIEEETGKALKKNERLIDTVAAERIRKELEEILKSNPKVIDQMTGLLQKWIPELDIMLHTEQNNVHHYTDVLHHTLDAVSASPSKKPEVLFALLLHDTGKPACKTTDETGDHFKKHPIESAKIASRVAKDLKMSRPEQDEIVQLVLRHDAFCAPKLANIYKLRVDKGWSDEMVKDLFDVQEGDILAHTTYDRMKQLEEFEAFYDQNKDRPLHIKDLKVNGDDVQKILQIQGPQVGQVLRSLLSWMFYHPEDNTREKGLLKIAQMHKTSGKEAKPLQMLQ